jgi:colanic acid biosynthesis glycosyl transferase WcaI
MHIAIIAQYFWPESVGPGVFLHQLAADLVKKGHQVTVVTAFPNYPHGEVAAGYRGRLFMRESLDGIGIIRTWIHTSKNKQFWARVFNFGSFIGSSFFGGLGLARPDVVYCYIPPLPLGVTADLICRVKGARLVMNVQDIHPDLPVQLGYLTNPHAIRFFQRMEKFIYRRSTEIVVISDQFRQNLEAKGVPAGKIHVVPNWADASEITPGPRLNDFRRQFELGDAFTVIYSGGLTHNSALPMALEAATLLRNEPFQFVIVGEGVHKPELQRLAKDRRLQNVRFLPFQPWGRYPLVLAAADLQLVSLNAASSKLSLPSKMLKIMAAGRPMLAQAAPDSQVAALIRAGDCGVAVHPDDPRALADAIRSLSRQPERLAAMGANARRYFLENFDRERCIAQLEDVLLQAGDSRSA